MTSFIGVGVYTIYPAPDRPFRDRITSLSRQQQEIRAIKAPDNLTPDERGRIQELQRDAAPAGTSAMPSVLGNTTDLEKRVRALEDKLNRAARALGSADQPRDT